MKKRLVFLTPIIITLICSISFARDTTQAIKELDKQIASATSPKTIANLHVFKARQHAIAGETDLAITSYINSLRVKQKGATWAELGDFYFTAGKYEKAFIVTAKVISTYPHLEEGAVLLEKSKKEQKRIYTKLYPETIIINSPVKGKRTRFDYENPNAQNVAILAAARKDDKSQRKEASRAYQKKVRELDDRYNKKLGKIKRDIHDPESKYRKEKYRDKHAKIVREQRKELNKLRENPVAYVPLEARKTRHGTSNNEKLPRQLSYSDGEHDAWAGSPQKEYGGAYAEGYEDEEETETNRSSNINGGWDNHGRHYSPAGGGNAWRNDGTFMQKAAGGYIDTKTGQFIPSN